MGLEWQLDGSEIGAYLLDDCYLIATQLLTHC
jgi:hypothetical protein